MRALIQRVKRAIVKIGGEEISKIGPGILIFLGIKEGDLEKDAFALAEKIVNLRIMADRQGKMNLSIKDVGGEILVVSQFTLYADTSYGRRPSFIKAADPQIAKELYGKFIKDLRSFGISVQTGNFGEYMSVELTNDGPVTLMIESPSTNSG